MNPDPPVVTAAIHDAVKLCHADRLNPASFPGDSPRLITNCFMIYSPSIVHVMPREGGASTIFFLEHRSSAKPSGIKIDMNKIPYKKSGGNVFADLGFAPETAAELTVKSSLIMTISDTIKARELTQLQAA